MKLEQKIPLETAITDVESWLDKKNVMPSARETYKENIEILVEAVHFGLLELKDDGSFVQTLMQSVDDHSALTTLNFRPRISARVLEPYLKGVKSGDGDGRVLAYLAALTEQPKGVLKALDSSDVRISNSIVVFFLG